MKKDKFSMSLEHNVMYAKRNIVDSIYSEAQLEGIGVTYPDTQELYDGRTVAGLSIEGTIKINNLKHAWHFILDAIDYPLDLQFIKQVNTEVGNGIIKDSGALRMFNVKIGGTKWIPDIPDKDKIDEHISSIMNNTELSVTEKAIDMMLYIMRGQLFIDGNKRTAQIVANKIMINGGAGIINIPVDRQKEFITRLIDYYESNDSKAISEFVYDNCIDGFDSKQLEKPKSMNRKDEIER